MAVPSTPIQVPSQRPLAPSVMSVTSVTNGNSDNEIIPGTVHRSPGICLTAEENPGKPQLGDRRIKGLCHKWGPFPPNEVGGIAQHVRKGEGRKGQGNISTCFSSLLFTLTCNDSLLQDNVICQCLFCLIYATIGYASRLW